MALIGENTRTVIDTDDDPNPVLITRSPTNTEEKEFHKKWINQKGRNSEINVEVVERFIDTILVDFENIEIMEDGKAVTLTKDKPDWKGFIPYGWKHLVAIKLQSQSVVSKDDEKNSDGAFA